MGRGRVPRKPVTDTQATMMRRITEELEKRQLTQAALARHAGMNQKTLNNIINGTVPELTQVHKIALGLGIHVSDLFRGDHIAARPSTDKVREIGSYPSWSAKVGKEGKLKRKVG